MSFSNTPRRLFRSRNCRVVAGICGGVAEYFNIDPSFVRLLFVLVCFVGFGMALIWYVIAWLIIPLAPISRGNSDNGYTP